MEIIIKAEPEEIVALVLSVQRQEMVKPYESTTVPHARNLYTTYGKMVHAE